MTLHDYPLFETIDDIPDAVSPVLLLPEDSDQRIVKAEVRTPATTSPVEVGYCFYNISSFGFGPEYQLLELYKEQGGIPDDFLRHGWNHLGRVVVKAMVDPDRQAPIDLVQAYRDESKFRGFSASEEDFFKVFVENWGVLRQR